jgi:hypothetical protein
LVICSGEQPDVPTNQLELASNDREEKMTCCQHVKEKEVDEDLDDFFASL